ncbi:MAG: hypothetical protein ACREMY_31390 [bacterium]
MRRRGKRIREKVFTKGLLLSLFAVLVAAVVLDLVWFTRRVVVESPWLAPQPILSAATLILGFILLVWQLGVQHRNTLEANRRQGQDRLKLDIYKEIAERIEGTRAPLTEFGMVPTGFVGELTLRQTSGIASHYQSQLRRLPKETSDSVVALMATLESYEIAMPGFAVFRTELSDSLRQAQAAYGDFVRLAAPLAESHTHPITTGNESELSRLATITMRATVDLTSVIWDLRVAAQNYLLGGLFPDRRVPERNPEDPSVRVIRLPKDEG